MTAGMVAALVWFGVAAVVAVVLGAVIRKGMG